MPVTNSHITSEFRDIAITDANGNVTGANLQQLNVATVAGLTIPGGSNTQVLTTDGAGNLSWQTPGIAYVPNLVQGTSNIKIAPNSNITVGVAGTANVITVSGNAVTLTGTVNFGAPNTLLIAGAGSAGFAVTGNDTSTGLQYNNSSLLASGNGYGRLIASGRRLFRAGAFSPPSAANQGVLAWGRFGDSEIATEMSINCGASAQPKYWQKIHSNISTIYALADTGVLYCTGADTNGQQGTGAATVSTAVLTALLDPKLYGSGITVVDFWSYDSTYNTNGDWGACMVTVDDNGTYKTYTFGYNVDGMLGNGSATTVNHVPTLITQFTGRRPISVAMQPNTCVVVLSDGTVWGSGYNTQGHLGVGNTTASNTFVQATDASTATITDAVEIALGLFYSSGVISGVNSFIRKSDGTVWGCGWNTNSRLAQGADVANKSRYVQIRTDASTFLTGITKISAAAGLCVARDSSGNLWSWASNVGGFWGNGQPTTANYPYATTIQTGVTDFYFAQRDVSPAGQLFIYKNGLTYAAGNNSAGSMGTADTASVVTTMSRVVFSEPGEYAVQFATGGDTNSPIMLFRTNTGRVYWSGSNNTRTYGGSSRAQLPCELTDIR